MRAAARAAAARSVQLLGWRASTNSGIGVPNGCASSVMQKNVPRIVPCAVPMRVQLVY